MPFYRGMLGSHSWVANRAGRGKKKRLRRQEATGIGDKEIFTVKVNIVKDGNKLKIFIIFNTQPESEVRENHRSIVAHELKNVMPGAAGNNCPLEDKVFLACRKTSKSNYEFAIMILKDIIMPKLGILTKGESLCIIKIKINLIYVHDAQDES